jgi:hypothetical protein
VSLNNHQNLELIAVSVTFSNQSIHVVQTLSTLFLLMVIHLVSEGARVTTISSCIPNAIPSLLNQQPTSFGSKTQVSSAKMEQIPCIEYRKLPGISALPTTSM